MGTYMVPGACTDPYMTPRPPPQHPPAPPSPHRPPTSQHGRPRAPTTTAGSDPCVYLRSRPHIWGNGPETSFRPPRSPPQPHSRPRPPQDTPGRIPPPPPPWNPPPPTSRTAKYQKKWPSSTLFSGARTHLLDVCPHRSTTTTVVHSELVVAGVRGGEGAQVLHEVPHRDALVGLAHAKQVRVSRTRPNYLDAFSLNLDERPDTKQQKQQLGF